MLKDTWEEDYKEFVENNPMTLCSGLSYRGIAKGSGTKEEIIKEYIQNNPDHTPTEIAKNTKVSRTTVYKYL